MTNELEGASPSLLGRGEKAQLLWSLYLSERDFIKHHENQRTTASNILAAVAAGLILASGNPDIAPAQSIIIPVLLMGVGLFGFLFCGRLYSLLQLHAARSYEYLAVLSGDHPDLKIRQIKTAVEAANRKRFPFFATLKLNHVWAWFHILIFASGGVLLVVALNNVFPGWYADAISHGEKLLQRIHR